MARLKDKIEEREQKVAQDYPDLKSKHKPVVTQLSEHPRNTSGKDKQISAKVNSYNYTMFTAINRIIGLSNNSALNMIITNYVRENKYLLDEDKEK